jgi:hypothetical protein
MSKVRLSKIKAPFMALSLTLMFSSVGVLRAESPESRVGAIGDGAITKAKAELEGIKNALGFVDAMLGELEKDMKSGVRSGSVAKGVAVVSAGIGLLGNVVAFHSANSSGDGVGVIVGAGIAGLSQTISGVSNSISMYQKNKVPAQDVALVIELAMSEIEAIESSLNSSEKIIVSEIRSDLENLSTAVFDARNQADKDLLANVVISAGQGLSTLSLLVAAKYARNAETALKVNLMVGATANFASLLYSLKDNQTKIAIEQIANTRQTLKRIASQI